jgi:tetratricopeptide (TPR) repeat protein
MDRAMRDLEAVLKVNPKHAAAQIQKGYIYHEMGDHLSAVEAFDAGLDLAPEAAHAWLWRAQSKAALGDKAGAEMDLAHARKLDPKVEE